MTTFFRSLGAFALLVTFARCGHPGKQPVRVAAASSLREVLLEIADAFTDSTGLKVEITCGASGTLAAQVIHGAPFEVFLSADTLYPHRLDSLGLTSGRPGVYAYGQLALVALPGKISLKGDLSSLLRQPEIHKIVIANPRTAPYGRAAQQILSNAGIGENTPGGPRVAIAENVGQVAQMVNEGAGDIGFTAASLLVNVPDHHLETRLLDGLWIPHSVALLKNNPSPDAETFVQFLFTPRAQNLLAAHGMKKAVADFIYFQF